MPSKKPLPTTTELVKAFHSGIRGTVEPNEDNISGSDYDKLAGLGAMMWTQQAQRDRDMFEGIYFETATGKDLTVYMAGHRGLDRILDAPGIGMATFRRPTAAFGSDTIYQGTRVRVSSATTKSKTYHVTGDISVASNLLSVPVPITSDDNGVGTAVVAGAGTDLITSLDDPLADPSWGVSAIVCGDGTDFEKAPDFKARAQAHRFDNKVGIDTQIVKACIAAGATFVAAFPSDYGGDATDFGLNVIYVGDAGYSSPPALVNACKIALEDWRVLGCDLQVLPMHRAIQTFNISVNLFDDPATIDTTAIEDAMAGAIIGYFSGVSNGFTYRLDHMTGLLMNATPGLVQNVSWSPNIDQVLLVETVQSLTPHFPSSLTRAVVSRESLIFSFFGPD